MWQKVILIVFAISLVTDSATAQSRCAPRSKLIAQLDRTFDEKLSSVGITFDGLLLEVWASKNGSWTVLVSRPNGRSCIVSHGEDWHGVPVSLPGQIS